MSSFETEEQAAEALANAVNEDAIDRGDAPSQDRVIADRAAEIRSAGEQASESADGSTGTTEQDSFTGIDPNSLPPELLPVYKSMQADYTRGKQGLSEQAQQYAALEEYGGPQAALEAAQFATALATDPQYALQVHEQLSTALQEAGLTPREAAQEASAQMAQAAGQAPVDEPDDYSFGEEPDSRLVQQLSQVQQELDAMKEWRENQEEIAMHQALEAEMDHQERRIFQRHPDWTDFDRDNLYNLAYSTGGNLEAAADVWENTRKALIEQYVEAKSSVATGVDSPSGGASNAEAPVEGIRDLFDPRIDRLVTERLAQLAASE